MGCGVACVAARIGRSYFATYRRHFRGKVTGDDAHRGYARTAIIAALADAGLAYVLRRFAEKSTQRRRRQADRSPEGTIVFVTVGRVGHYLLRHRNGWMDRLKGFTRRLPRSAIPRTFLAEVH